RGIRRRTSGAVDGPGCQAATHGRSVSGVTTPSSRKAYRPARIRLAAATSTESVLSQSAPKSLSTRSRACRQNRSASSIPSGRGAARGGGPYAARRHREQFRPDVDDPAEEPLLAFQPALPAGHGIEGGPGDLARGPLDEAQVAGEPAELGVPGGGLAAADREG